MAAGEWRAHPGRGLTGILAIAIGVALGFAVHLVNQTALASFDRAVASVGGAADLQVHSVSPAGFGEGLYPKLATAPGVAAVSPVVELQASFGRVGNAPGSNRLTLLGLDPLRAMAVTPGLIGVVPGAGPGGGGLDADAMFVSKAALAATGTRIGDTVTLTAAGRPARFRIAGVLAGTGEDAILAVVDIAEAQWRFGQLGRLQRLDLKLAEGSDPKALAALLPADAQLVTPDSSAARSSALSRAYRVNLEMLAMVALLTGGFLVYSAQSLSVARRRPQFALLRVLGLERRDLTRQIVLEGAAVGLAGAALGILLGQGLAALTLRVLGGDLGGGYFRQGSASLGFAPWAALAFTGLGVAVAVASSLVPAREGAAARPAVALKTSGEAGDPRSAPRALPALLLLAAGGLAALGPPVWGLPLLGYAAMALLLAGGVAAMPALARLLITPLQALRLPPALDLAAKRLWGAPNAAAVALCGIVASTSLMVAMAVMVTSFRGSVEDWLTAVLPADVYLHVEGAEAGGLDRQAQARLAATPGVKGVQFVRQMPLRMAADKPAVVLSGQHDPAGSLALIGRRQAVPAGATAAWISEPMAWLYDLEAGDTLILPLPGAPKLFVAGVWRDYARQFGAIALADADFVRLTGDATKTEGAVTLAPGAQPQAVIAAMKARMPPGLAGQTLFGEPAEMRRMALSMFDRSFAITYALEAIAVVIGLAGVAATFSAQTLARTREFGMLRHIGVTRRQIGLMLAAEGALLGLVGGIAGIALGLAMAQVLIHVVNPQSFHWTMDTQMPWRLLLSLVPALVAAAAGAAVLAGRRALSADAVRAVREDW
jgi:putative ABC transport system permease protein